MSAILPEMPILAPFAGRENFVAALSSALQARKIAKIHPCKTGKYP